MLGRALISGSQEGSELAMIQRRGMNTTGDRVAVLKGKI